SSWPSVHVDEFVQVQNGEREELERPLGFDAVHAHEVADEADARFDLRALGRTGEREPDRALDLRRGRISGLAAKPARERLRLVRHVIAVEHGERLRRLDRREALGAGLIGVGEVEDVEERWYERSLHVDVDAPPRAVA